MGNCKYCGKGAGFLRSKHPECEQKYLEQERAKESGRQKVRSEIVLAIRGSESLDTLQKRIIDIEKTHSIPTLERNEILIKGWESSVDYFLEDGVLDKNEEKALVEFKNHFSLSETHLDRNGAWSKIVKAAVLRDIFSGIVPQRLSICGAIPINFQKGEQIVWAFANCKYLEDKVHRKFVGGSHGVSVRIMKGVYYRVGAFKGQPVAYTERLHIDNGWVVITTKNLYFAGPQKSMRIPHAKIVSFEPFSDGIGIMRDSASAKMQIFVTGDGWFTYNVLSNM